MKNAILPIILMIIIITGVGYLLFKPEKAIGPKNDSNSNLSEDNESQVGENMDNEFSFPGILPDEQIKNKKVIIETEKGSIEIELYADKAPKTVSNFVYLVSKEFYNGLTFHRVEPTFVVQGGDPNGDGTGGPGYKFEDETVQGDYIRGSVAMANSGANTNGSQFFICLEDQKSLPKKYNLFGQVIKGMDVIDQIAIGDVMNSMIIEPLNQ